MISATRLFGTFAVLAAIGGFLLGLAVPSPVRAATVNYELWVHPGGSLDYLNCGWHGACYDTQAKFIAGDALDLDEDENDSTYFRANGIRDDTTNLLTIATGDTDGDTSGCDRVTVEIRDNVGSLKGVIEFVHQDSVGVNFTLHGRSSGYTQSKFVSKATSPSQEATGCSTGPHLHEHQTSGFTVLTSNYPIATWDNDQEGERELNSFAAPAMYKDTWTID